MAASSSSRLRTGLKRSSSITSTTLKTKKKIETKEAIEFSFSSSAVESVRNLGEPINRFFQSKVPCSKYLAAKLVERIAKAVVYIHKYGVDRKDVLIGAGAGAAAAAAAIRRMGGVVKEESLTGSYSVKADSYNWISSMWTMEETSSDFINCNLDFVEELLDKVKWGEKGEVVAIFQDVDTGKVLRQRFANREDLATAISSGRATFDDPSLSLLTKGQISSNFNIHNIYLSCNCDSLIFIGKPDGPTCHTCSETCYHNSVVDYLNNHRAAQNRPPLTTLYSLEARITRLQLAKVETIVNGTPALTKQLMLNPMLLCSKIREEVNELCQTLQDNEEGSRTASKMADVLYHAMVLLRVRDIKLEEIVEVLRKQFLPVR